MANERAIKGTCLHCWDDALFEWVCSKGETHTGCYACEHPSYECYCPTTLAKPLWATLWSADQAAECLPFERQAASKEEGDALYARLWDCLQPRESSELPDDLGDKGWWAQLTERQQELLCAAYRAEFGEEG